MSHIRNNNKKKSIQTKVASTNEHPQTEHKFPIVGIGASAGGIEAFERFFRKVDKSDMAYVVITHLDRSHTSNLTEIISNFTLMTVATIKNRTQVKPNTIYVIPPKKNVIIKNGSLMLVDQLEPHYANLPINHFLKSLAEECHENAIAVILSGSGSDGSAGIRDIKDYGGLIFAQEPATAAFDSMPLNAIRTGLVDYQIPPEEMPEQIKKQIRHGKFKDGIISPELYQIFALLKSRTGHDFSHYKLNTVCRRIEKQMHTNHIKTLPVYVRFLHNNTHEIDNLFQDLLIGVTRFFRDEEAFKELQNKILPQLLEKKSKNYTLRIWIPACSTGEEVYSVAIVICECLAKLKKQMHVQIFGTDIDLRALEFARSGLYPESTKTAMSEARLKNHFIKEGKSYRIKKNIRSMIVFGEQDIIKDPPFTKMDIICCRNLLIYLNTQIQKKVLQIFHYSLKMKGILFLGASEATSGLGEYFQQISKKAKIFERKTTEYPSSMLMNFTSFSPLNGLPEIQTLDKNDHNLRINFREAVQEFLLNNFISPALVISKHGDILYVHGQVNKYFNQTSNHESLNIYDDIISEIKLLLVPAIRRVEISKAEIICKNLKISTKPIKYINLRIIPIKNIEVLYDLILVLFEDITTIKNSNAKKTISKKENERLEDMVQELRYTKENLQATIEELESGNEELQATNEELQSTNEEIETSKEELQSLNEELLLVNTELQNTIDQLASVNDDLSNLFNSSEIAAFFLDNNLCIKRFTPKAKEFIHLIQSDVGRSIRHFATTIKYDKLAESAEEVLKTLTQKNIEVESDNNRWFQIRILPYRTLTNMIDGVVITLSDITLYKDYENKQLQLNQSLKDALTYNESIINTIVEPIVVINDALEIISANRSFYKLFQLEESQVSSQIIFDIAHKAFDITTLRSLIDKAIKHNIFLEGEEIEVQLNKDRTMKFSLNIRPIQQLDGHNNLILLAMNPY